MTFIIFDAANHNILLNKLENCPFRGSVLQWFATYLKNRFQVVKLNNIFCDKIQIESRILQGSILGPPFFFKFMLII